MTRWSDWILILLAAAAVFVTAGANGNPWPFPCRDARPSPTCRFDAELVVDGCVPVCRCVAPPPTATAADTGDRGL